MPGALVPAKKAEAVFEVEQMAENRTALVTIFQL
jgi:hypothetical protein